MSGRRGRLSVLGYGLAMLTGRLPKLKSYCIVTAEKVHIAGPADDPVQGDGDIIGHLDVTIEVVPGGIHLVFPPDAEAADAAALRCPAGTGSPSPERVAAAAPRR